MLSSKKIIVPEKLINLAKQISPISAGIVCANQADSMLSAKHAFNLGLINPIFIGNKISIQEEAENIDWSIKSFETIEENSDQGAAIAGAKLAKNNQIKILIKGNIHTDTLMRIYLKKEFGLIGTRRLSHIWHMSLDKNDKPIFITDGALNVAPRIDIKMQILKNAVEFAKKIGIQKPRVAVLSGTEDVIESMPSSIDAKEIMKRSKEEKIDAFVHGPLAFDNAVSPKAATIKKITGEVPGMADILLVPNLETGNSLSKMMVYFLGACAAGIIIGGKVPVVVTSRADDVASRLSSIAAAIIATK